MNRDLQSDFMTTPYIPSSLARWRLLIPRKVSCKNRGFPRRRGFPVISANKYLRVSGVFLWAAAHRYVSSSRRCVPALLASASEWGSHPEHCRRMAGSPRSIRCRWCQCCWISWNARPRPSSRTDPPVCPRAATRRRRRVARHRVTRPPVAWREPGCHFRRRCWSSWPRTRASWPRRAIPWLGRESHPGLRGAPGPPGPPDLDNFVPSWLGARVSSSQGQGNEPALYELSPAIFLKLDARKGQRPEHIARQGTSRLAKRIR